MSEFAKWIVGLIKSLFSVVWDFLTDLLIALADIILTAVLGLISALPLPSFLKPGGLQVFLQSIDPSIMFFVSHFRLGECFAFFGAAVAFRLARKAVTLFQW